MGRRIPFSRSDGFSLTEILVVIGIVAVLAAMLFPAIGRMQMWTRNLQCCDNLRKMAISLHLYARDHDGNLPSPYADTSSTLWVSSSDFASYIGTTGSWSPTSRQAVTCPSWNGKWAATGRTAYSYSLCYPYYTDTTNLTPFRLTQYSHPAENIMLFDGAPQSSSANYTWAFVGRNPTLQGFLSYANRTPGAFRHENRMNASFADGHVEALTASQITERMVDTNR